MKTSNAQGRTLDPRRYEQLIEGQFVPASSGATYDRLSPFDGGLVETIPWSGIEDLDAAVASARSAFDAGTWSHAPAAMRAAVLGRTAARLREKSRFFASLITDEMGKPIATSELEVQLTAEVFDYYAALALDVRGESASHYVPTALGLTVPEPVGVVGVLTPWNFPLLLTAWKLAPALAAGCAVVAKPSELAAGSILELARSLLEAGVPAGVLNVITGPGDVLGAALVRHPGVDKIAFTGSTEVGKRVMEGASATLKRVSLELGGKCANIVFPDADLHAAIGGAIAGAFVNAGQVCMAGSRLLVHESIREPFVQALVSAVRGLPVGDPRRQEVVMGPLVSEQQRRRVLEYIEIGKAEGATLLTGGRPMSGAEVDAGHFVEPTIFGDVTNSMRIAQEEIFGPVLSILTFKDARHAMELANDSPYGLAAAVWTKDLETAFSTARGIRAGTVWVNGYHSIGLSSYMPFGGFKQSGIGREVGRKGLDEYLETKSIHVKLGAR